MVNPFELHPEVKKHFEKKSKKLLTKENMFDIINSEIEQFKRLDHPLMVSLLKKLKCKFDDLKEDIDNGKTAG